MWIIRECRLLVGVLGLVLTHASTAAPVTMLGQQWLYDHFGYAQADGLNIRFGDSTCLSACENGWTFEQESSNEFGSAQAKSFSHVDAYSASSEESFTWGAIGTLETIARVDLGLTDGRAIAEARMFGFSVAFAITEHVLFTGTHALDGFLSGKILQPGIYLSREQFLPTLTVEAHEGETAVASLARRIEYSFTSVPAPPAAALALLGIAGVVASRWRRSSR